MSKQTINLGAVANDQTGDALRVGGQKINSNFDEVYSMLTEGNLGSFSQIIGQADRLPYFTGVGALSVTTLNALGRSIIGAASQLAARQALGLGTSSTFDRGTANGVASLGADGKLVPSQTPDMSINDVYPVASQAEMLALPADQGDIAIRTDELNKPYILGALPASTLANWYPIGQSLSAALAALSGLTPAADRIPYYTGANTAALATFNALGRSLVGAASPAAARTALGLGTSDSLAIGAVEITAALPFIDFHFNNTTTDYDVRLINSAAGTLNAVVASGNEFRINGSTAWNDAIAAAKLAAISVGGIGSYAFCLTNTALTPGATTVGGNLQYAFAVGQGSSSPTGTWRCMGDTVAGGRTLFQRVS